VRRVQRYRTKKKAEKKAARHAVLMAEKAARDARRVARQEKKALDLRKHSTQRQGFCDGYNSAAPKSEAELKAQSWAKRYREGYAKGRAEKQRVDALLTQQQARPTPTAAPVTIQP
jgi:cell division septum initiation protein DivIVA